MITPVSGDGMATLRSDELPIAAPTDRLEAVRAYWNRRPCNLRHSPAPVGGRAYFDEVEARKYRVEPHIPGFADFARWRGRRVLEIGCGIGTDAVNFARAGALVTLVDVSEESLALCRRRFEVFGLEARFHRGNAERLDELLPAQPYDLIYSFGAIHHTPQPERIVTQLARYCGPDTELRLMLYARWSWKALSIVLREGRGAVWRAGELFAAHSEAQTGCPVSHAYTARQVRALLADFEVTSLRKDHIFPYDVAKYVAYAYEKRPFFRQLPEPALRWLERALGAHWLVVARPRPEGRGRQWTTARRT
jgi:SAM-dependent methyltransferase